MKKLFVLAIAAVVLFVLASAAIAVPPGKTVEFDGKAMGKVVFDGKIHADAGVKCADCHTKIFKYKKGADAVTMKDINEGKFCGTCHKAGGKAIDAKNSANCGKCHKK